MFPRLGFWRSMKHVNIPIFIPHLGCPNGCVFCNQRSISGKERFNADNMEDEIRQVLSTVERPAEVDKSLSQPNQPLYGIQFTNDGQIVIFGGGVPLKINGKIVGGLGVSGGSEDQDTYLADFGGKVFDELVKENF